MIDLHIHILPGLDDGAGSPAEALDMARGAYADGSSAVVATPHVIAGLYRNTRETIVTAVGQFNELLQQNEIPLAVLPGAEYQLEPGLPGRFARGDLLTINDGGRYLLVELPAAFVPDYTIPVIYNLLLQGAVPVIAHPERNAGLIKNPALLYDLIERGALAQITAGSLTGNFGSASAAAARLFLEHGCAHFIATDAHSMRGGRTPALAAAAREAARLTGEVHAQSLVDGNPGRALQGKSITVTGLREIRPARRGFLKKFFSLF